MTILVDGLTTYSETKLRYKTWCHMVSDTSGEELDAFAILIGLSPAWVQRRPAASTHHYDLTPSKRALALRHGAQLVSGRELVLRNYDGFFRRRTRGELSAP